MKELKKGTGNGSKWMEMDKSEKNRNGKLQRRRETANEKKLTHDGGKMKKNKN